MSSRPQLPQIQSRSRPSSLLRSMGPMPRARPRLCSSSACPSPARPGHRSPDLPCLLPFLLLSFFLSPPPTFSLSLSALSHLMSSAAAAIFCRSPCSCIVVPPFARSASTLAGSVLPRVGSVRPRRCKTSSPQAPSVLCSGEELHRPRPARPHRPLTKAQLTSANALAQPLIDPRPSRSRPDSCRVDRPPQRSPPPTGLFGPGCRYR